MANYSLHLGVNAPAASHYRAWVPSLRWAEKDASDWKAFFDSRGWRTSLEQGQFATTGNLKYWIGNTIHAGDAELVVITWSGHGTQVRQGITRDLLGFHGGREEADGRDEQWVMYNRLFFDEEVRDQIARFRPPTKVVVIADSCHSGTIFQLRGDARGSGPRPSEDDPSVALGSGDLARRDLADWAAESVVEANQAEYSRALRSISGAAPTADFVGLAACMDAELAFESRGNGHFTRAALRLLKEGFAGNYDEFLEAVKPRLERPQTPVPYWYGARAGLLRQPVFS
ncbi:MAG TPA: caspase family protein [Arachnia sp.]|nr:caspase family protein [Arachnia sp.]HMT86429.1 caspase family protein [Arachnia sp.]